VVVGLTVKVSELASGEGAGGQPWYQLLDAIPVVGVKLSVLELPSQIVDGDAFTVTFGFGLTVIVNALVSEHPLPLSSVTTKVYVVVVVGETVNGPGPFPMFGVHL